MSVKKREQYFSGVRMGLSTVLGFVPVGVAYALMARQAGFTVFETIFMSASVFAGASQMMAVGMVAQGAGLTVVILATFIMNLRHLIMSTCVFNRVRDAGLGVKLLAAFGVTDESFGIFAMMEEEKCSIPFFLGLITVTYSSWVGGTALGALASDFIPALLASALGIALYAMFIGILTPNLQHNGRLCLLVVITGAVNAVLNRLMDSNWALIVSTLACAAGGMFFVEPDGEKAEEKI